MFEDSCSDRRHQSSNKELSHAQMCSRFHVNYQWISEQRDEGQQLDERTGPAMGQDQGNPAPLSRPLIHEMDVDAVDSCPKLCKVVEPGLLCSPVKAVLPVIHQLLEILSVRAIVPPCSFHLIRKAECVLSVRATHPGCFEQGESSMPGCSEQTSSLAFLHHECPCQHQPTSLQKRHREAHTTKQPSQMPFWLYLMRFCSMVARFFCKQSYT
jgi:hypothetical protein